MSLVLHVDPGAEPDPGAVRATAGALERGALVVFPTETVYGIGARPDDRAATERLFAAKRRPPGLNLPVLAASPGEALELGAPDPRAEALARALWPGPLTVVLRRSARSAPWYLGEREDTVGVRVPDHPVALAVLRAFGPVATTSANLSGLPPLRSEDDLRATFGEAVEVYLVVAPSAMPPGERPSTVVDLTGDRPRVLRSGPIPAERIAEVLGQPVEGSG
ncbi:MAG TPA: L-threonylcarbamoyladenylate synthase [Actinomycetota bacterium]|nr:L-threonylcarbamoyladenylate synthase [Actinomycetota bacterium]